MLGRVIYKYLSEYQWRKMNKNENELYCEFGRLVVELESISHAVIQFMTFFYIDFGMKGKPHAIQIALNREDFSKLLEIYVNTIEYFYILDTFEKRILNKWKSSLMEISAFRNTLTHSKWATGWFSRTDNWEKAIIISSKRRQVGADNKIINKKDINNQRNNLREMTSWMHCIFKCISTFKIPFKSYFEVINNEIVHKKDIWNKFLKIENKKDKELFKNNPNIKMMDEYRYRIHSKKRK